MKSTAWLGLAWAVLALGCAEPATPAAPTVVELRPASPAGASPVAASSATPHDEEPPPKPKAGEPRLVGDYTCSMHPQIHEPSAGTCPICGMDLIELDDR